MALAVSYETWASAFASSFVSVDIRDWYLLTRLRALSKSRSSNFKHSPRLIDREESSCPTANPPLVKYLISVPSFLISMTPGLNSVRVGIELGPTTKSPALPGTPTESTSRSNSTDLSGVWMVKRTFVASLLNSTFGASLSVVANRIPRRLYWYLLDIILF